MITKGATMGTKWRGMLAPLGVSTGDGRRFSPDGITHRELPLPLKWQRIDEAGHDTSVVVGAVDILDIQPDAVWAEGEFFDDLDPETFERLLVDVNEAMFLSEKQVIGPSVDAGAVEMAYVKVGDDTPLTMEELDELYWDEMETGEPAKVEVLFTKYEISAATLVTTPAFAECRPFELITAALTASVRRSGWDALGFASRDLEWDGTAAEQRIANDANVDGDNPDWSRYAEAFLYQADDADPETKGAYGFQIVDIVDGERVIVPRAVFAVAGVLQGSRGGTTIPDQDQQTMKEVVGGLYERMASEFEDDSIVAPWDAACTPTGKKKKPTSAALVEALTAAASVRTYDLGAFAPPAVPESGLVSMTVTADGRVYGHIATHDVCHVGMPGVCMTAPVDLAEFDQFHRYSVMGSDGQMLTVGRLTYGAGALRRSCGCCPGKDDHACSHLSMGGAIAHHDQMTTVAWVRAWEDTENNAIRVAGVLADGITPEQITALSRGRVSGDWRAHGTNLALTEILVLSRERPGFPLPRGRMVDHQMMALTAAGTVRPSPATPPTIADGINYAQLAAMIADHLATTMQPATPADEQDATTSDIDHAGEATSLVAELGMIFASRDEVEARRLAGDIEEITHVLR